MDLKPFRGARYGSGLLALATVICAISVNSHYLQTRGKNRFLVLFGRSRLMTMANFRVVTTDFYPKILHLRAPNPKKVWGTHFRDFEIDITLILDFTLNAQITEAGHRGWSVLRATGSTSMGGRVKKHTFQNNSFWTANFRIKKIFKEFLFFTHFKKKVNS